MTPRPTLPPLPAARRGLSDRGHLGLLAVVFAAVWLALAIAPLDRHDWALENALVLAVAVAIAATHRRLLLSRTSYTLIFLFLCLHEVGAHYTYAKVPYDQWIVALTGRSLNQALGWQRNQFDRVVHFLYGALLAVPLYEIGVRALGARGGWAWCLPVDLTLSTSALFELFEWGAAEVFGGDLGVAYLGTQGDVWDAHKDMVLATLGACVVMAALALRRWRGPSA